MPSYVPFMTDSHPTANAPTSPDLPDPDLSHPVLTDLGSTGSGLPNRVDLTPTVLEREWVVTIDTPVGGIDQLTQALGEQIPLVQGPYDNCLYVRMGGYQQFRALDGSHAGAEGTIQRTEAAQLEFAIPPQQERLAQVFDVIFAAHVNEEPTIRVSERLASRSKLLDDAHNPNRYWNRPDAEALHGDVVS